MPAPANYTTKQKQMWGKLVTRIRHEYQSGNAGPASPEGKATAIMNARIAKRKGF